MNFQTVKKESEVELLGVAVEIESQNGSHRAITLRDGNGRLVRISSTYGIDILIPAPPKTVKKFRLEGTFAGLVPVSEDFDDEYMAKDRLREFERNRGYDSELGLKITPVEVLESE